MAKGTTAHAFSNMSVAFTSYLYSQVVYKHLPAVVGNILRCTLPQNNGAQSDIACPFELQFLTRRSRILISSPIDVSGL